MATSLPLNSSTDVLIVGGGLAGLALADHLTIMDRDFLLLEARDRLGGRVLTQQVEDVGFDLGPAWFWPGQPRMARLTQKLRLDVFEQYSQGDLMAEDGQGNTRRGAGWASMEGSFRISGGIGRVIDGLHAQLAQDRIITKNRVVRLRQDGSAIIASVGYMGETQEITANKVVLAIPPRIVAETVSIQPALPNHTLDAMRQTATWMAGQAKIVAIYDNPHWREAGLSGDAMSQRGPMVEIHDASPGENGPYALFGFVGVPAAARQGHGPEIKQLALDQLVRLFGENMAQPREIVLMDWAQDPLTAISLDHDSAGHHPAYGRPKALSGIWNDSLILGSTELGTQFGGYLEGALEVAEDVSEILGKA